MKGCLFVLICFPILVTGVVCCTGQVKRDLHKTHEIRHFHAS